MRPKYPPARLRARCQNLSISPQRGPSGPFSISGPVMTKTTTKSDAPAKQSASSAPLIVLGYDENHKPRAARFPAKDVDLSAKAAQLMDLKVYGTTAREAWLPLPKS